MSEEEGLPCHGAQSSDSVRSLLDFYTVHEEKYTRLLKLASLLDDACAREDLTKSDAMLFMTTFLEVFEKRAICTATVRYDHMGKEVAGRKLWGNHDSEFDDFIVVREVRRLGELLDDSLIRLSGMRDICKRVQEKGEFSKENQRFSNEVYVMLDSFARIYHDIFFLESNFCFFREKCLPESCPVSVYEDVE